jgi:uncharacterized membrane protein
MLWQSVLTIIVGVIFYLIDCLVAHKMHPEVSWLESGVYMGGLGGFYVSVIVVLIGIYFLQINMDLWLGGKACEALDSRREEAQKAAP